MKKGLTVLFAMMILSVSAFADQRIDPTTLPANIQEAVKGWYPNATIMFSEVPSAIAAAVAKQYPNVVMVEIEKEYQGYEIKLQNRMELYFNLQGQLLYQKYDD